MPRFVVKYFSSVYLPLDKDLVREMWVTGDLKQRLGVEHRKDKRRKGTDTVKSGDIETLPIFHASHERSISEISLQAAQSYEMTPRGPGVVDHSYVQSPSGHDDTPPHTEDLGKTTVTQEEEDNQPPSPQPSYYSVSDIPPPSPIPESIYRYPSGEYTRTPPSSRRPSISSRTVTSVIDPMPSPPPLRTSTAHPLSLHSRASSEAPRPPVMGILSQSRGVSDASYTTADEGSLGNGYDDDDVDQQSSDSWQGGRAL